MDLADRAIDAPLSAHVAPMQDEPFDGFGELCGFVRNFCHDRNIGNKERMSRGVLGYRRDRRHPGTLSVVIPGRRESGEPGIHNPCCGVWISGSSLRSAPE